MTVVWLTRHLLFSNIELIVMEVETWDIVKTSVQLDIRATMSYPNYNQQLSGNNILLQTRIFDLN